MQRSPAASFIAAIFTILVISFLSGCGGSSSSTANVVAKIVINPTTLSLNQGQVSGVSAIAQNATGSVVAADITFSSSNTSLAQISSGGLICAGAWDANIITCTPTLGASAVGQVTITATASTNSAIKATTTVYVHERVDRVTVTAPGGCTSMGQLVNPTAQVFNTSDPNCSLTAPCDITSTVGPITIGSIDQTVAASASGINPTYSSATNSPTYTSGGTITGSAGQTCNLTNFSLGGSLGIDPTFNAATKSPTYVSGGTVTGSGGQTCTLSNFNGVTGATATVTLIGANTIAPGAQLTVTNSGFGATTAPTTATLTNGSATCSGTATVITRLATVSGSGTVTDATATVTLTGSNTIASGTQLTITNQGFGATAAPTTATLSNGTATCSGTANVITSLNSATGFKAQNPGSTSVFASVSGVNSVGTPFNVCPVASIFVHSATDSTTNFALNPGATQGLVADVLDSSGMTIRPSLTWASNVPASSTATTASTGSPGGTATAVSQGTTTITATCSNPDCNIGVPPQYSLNQVTVTVPGGANTTVYAASTQSTTLIPITTSNNAAGTAITLPFLPNSILADPTGKFVYLGSSGGLMQVNVATGAVATVPVTGILLAISPDGNYVVTSDSSKVAVYVFNVSTASTAFLNSTVATGAAFTPDSKTTWFFRAGFGTAFADALSSPSVQFALPYTPDAVAFNATGSLGYFTSSIYHQIDIRSSCDRSEVQTFNVNAPTLMATISSGNGVVAADSPNLDVVTSSNVLGGCPTAATNSFANYNLNVGAFTPNQLFLSSDSSRAWLLTNLPEVVAFNLTTSTPFVIPLVNGAIPLNGGIRMDGREVYVGASDGTVHQVDVVTEADQAQIAVGLKDSNSNPVNPNLVAVVP